MENVLKFNGSWRDYQQKILDDLNFHLTDNKIHIVAAPGAGKTTLGIEIIARLNKPVLIFAPTITIRNQWKQRITEAFLTDTDADIISTDIRKPKRITIITYQALLAAFCGEENTSKQEELAEISYDYDENDDFNDIEEVKEQKTKCNNFNKNRADAIISTIKKSGIKVLCFDEAHHLRNEWWKALDYLMEKLKPSQTLALTATPPYDVDMKEWERYEALCGPIDEIISIPELVKNGDLCPHQDFIHFSFLKEKEVDEINNSLERRINFINSLISNGELIKEITKILDRENEETMLNEPSLYVALASFLKTAERNVPQNFLEIFALREKDIPPFKTKYIKLLLSFVLFSGKIDKELSEDLYNKAKHAGILYNKSIYLNDSPKLKRQIARSVGKLDSIKTIVEHEVSALKNDLRMVILADYIKLDVTDCTQLGVIPIWQILKDNKEISLAVLTGSIILIHKKLEKALNEKIAQKGLFDFITYAPFDRDENYLKINVKDTKKSVTVELLTEMFNEGLITVLTGTQALLGEGWDAPCINSLILSSTVSSYMLSNQMRGRAIRKDKNSPNKVSNIWHLASVKTLHDFDVIKALMPKGIVNQDDQLIQLQDFDQLRQRFNGYEAPSFTEPCSIENGIDRILPRQFLQRISRNPELLKDTDFKEVNNTMLNLAFDRKNTRRLWHRGLLKDYNAPTQRLKTGVITTNKMKTVVFNGGYKAFVASYFSLFLAPAMYIFITTGDTIIPTILTMIFFMCMIKPTIKFIRCSSPDRVIRQIGIIVVETLYSMGLIKTNLKNINVECRNDEESSFLAVDNVSPEENNLIINSITEILNPIENPRYLLVRNNPLLFWEATDFHAVPNIIGQKKENVEVFAKLWNKYIGKCGIIYTRNSNGRKALLNARKQAFSDLLRKGETKKQSRFE